MSCGRCDKHFCSDNALDACVARVAEKEEGGTLDRQAQRLKTTVGESVDGVCGACVEAHPWGPGHFLYTL